MELFIDREPIRKKGIVLTAVVTEPDVDSPPPNLTPQSWILDTGFVGEAFCWRVHLEVAGLNIDVNRFPGFLPGHTSLQADQPSVLLPIRMSNMWLISNQAELKERPFRLDFNEGIAFRDDSLPPKWLGRERALIGMKALARAKVKIEIDFSNMTFSLWVPR
jgi:hypothetical protein